MTWYLLMLDVSISAAMWRSVGLAWGPDCRARCQECSWWQGSVLSQYFDCSSRHARKLKTWLSFLMFLPTDPYSLGMIELMSASLHRVKYEILSKPAKVLVHRVVLKEFRHHLADQDAVETYCSRDFMYVCPCPKFIFNYEDVLVSRACLCHDKTWNDHLTRWTTRFTDSLSSRPWLRDQVWTKVWIRLKYQGLKHVGSFLTISRILRNLDLWTQPCQASTATSTLYSLLACSVLSHSECFGTPTPRAFSSCKAHRGDILARLTSIPEERFCRGQRTESCNGGFHQKLE